MRFEVINSEKLVCCSGCEVVHMCRCHYQRFEGENRLHLQDEMSQIWDVKRHMAGGLFSVFEVARALSAHGANRSLLGSAVEFNFSWLHTTFFLSLLFLFPLAVFRALYTPHLDSLYRQRGGDIFLRNVRNHQKTTRCHNPEDHNQL